MSAKDRNRRVRLSIEVQPELHRLVKIAAAKRDMTMKDYVVSVLEDVAVDEDAALTQLSTPSFARDWESEEDQVYDDVS